MSPEHPPGWTATRRRRSSRPSCSRRLRTLPAATSVRLTPWVAVWTVSDMLAPVRSCARERIGYLQGTSWCNRLVRPVLPEPLRTRLERAHGVGEGCRDVIGGLGDRVHRAEARRGPLAPPDLDLTGEDDGGDPGRERRLGDRRDGLAPQGLPVEAALARDDAVARGDLARQGGRVGDELCARHEPGTEQREPEADPPTRARPGKSREPGRASRAVGMTRAVRVPCVGRGELEGARARRAVPLDALLGEVREVAQAP